MGLRLRLDDVRFIHGGQIGMEDLIRHRLEILSVGGAITIGFVAVDDRDGRRQVVIDTVHEMDERVTVAVVFNLVECELDMAMPEEAEERHVWERPENGVRELPSAQSGLPSGLLQRMSP